MGVAADFILRCKGLFIRGSDDRGVDKDLIGVLLEAEMFDTVARSALPACLHYTHPTHLSHPNLQPNPFRG